MAALSSIVLWSAYSRGDEALNSDYLVLASVEALAQEEGSVISNTGPRKETECEGGYHKMVCVCQNSNPCTDSECY